jgi:gliding motility-associated-like protein
MRRLLKISVLVLSGSINCALYAQFAGGKHYINSDSLTGFNEAARKTEMFRPNDSREARGEVLPETKREFHNANQGGVLTTSLQAKGGSPSTASSCAGFTTTSSCGNYTLTNTGAAAPAVQSYSFMGVNAPSSFTTTAPSSTVSFAVGSYTIMQVVSDSTCSDTQSVAILVLPPPDAGFTTANYTQCMNGNSFIFSAKDTLGTHSYSFNPTAGAPSPGNTFNYGPVSFSSPGTFTVTHSINSGCAVSASSVIAINPNPSATLSQTNASCGLSNGAISISNTSSVQTITGYSLNAVAVAGPNITGLAAGTYSILVANNFGCVTQYSVTISDTPPLTALQTASTDPSCGNNNGAINIGLVSGGTPGYSFNINGGAYGSATSFTNLIAGSYTIGVMDNAGCVFTKTIVLNNMPGPSSASISVTNAKCGNSNGSATITSVTGGTSPYQYAFNGGAFTGANSVSGLSAGTYSVIIKDVNNCTITANFNVVDPGNPSLTVNNLTNVNCFGSANGNLSLNASGGSSGYTYTLNPGSLSNSTGIFSGLSAQNYIATVSDAVGCLSSVSVAITQPAPLALNFTTTPNTCAGSVGSVTLGVSGGMPAYSYSVDGNSSSNITTGLANGTHTAVVKDANGCMISGAFNMNLLAGPNTGTVQVTNSTCGNANGTATVTSVAGGVAPYQYAFNGGSFSGANNVSGLSAGSHSVIIRDANTCTVSLNFSIVDPGNPILVLNNKKDVSCFGFADGTFTMTASGGFSGYSYTLNPGPVGSGSGIFSGLTAQTYSIVVNDAIGCAATMTVNVSQPTALGLTITPTNITCNGLTNGFINLNPTGGTLPYQYSINGGAYASATSYTGLGVGNYSITIRDNNNCTVTKTTSISQPAPLALSFTTIPNSCTGTVGSVTIGVTGGTPAFSYSVDGTASSYTATNLSSGNHNASVKDANGCTIAGTFSIGLITGPTNANLAISNAPCGNNNSSATVTAVSGGTPAYVYSFNGGPFSSITSVGNLAAGAHNVIVKDANTCTVNVNFIVSNTTSQQFAITGVSSVNCFGGSSGSFTATSNTSGTYTIIPGGYTNTTGIFTNLPAGGYTVMIQHAAGCVATVTVTVPQPPTPVTLALNSSGSVSCFNGNNASITASGSGGAPPYQYSINGGTFQTSTTFNNLTAGFYNITVKDNSGCTATKTINITQPSPINLITSAGNSTCTAANGSVSVVASGGTPAYSYTWTGGAGYSAQANNLPAGSYTVTVGDANNCTQTAVATINASQGGMAVISASTNVSCFGTADGNMTAGVNGAMTAPLSYSWSNGQTTPTAMNLPAGNYTVTITDTYGCTSSASASISQPGALTFGVISNSVSCFGGNNGNANAVYIGGGTPPLSYLWSPGAATTTALSNVMQGIYTCTLTDSKGCTAVQSTTINQPTSVTLTSSLSPATCGQTNGGATVTATGGVSPYNFNWSVGSSGPILSNAGVGTYSVNVTDANNCTYTTAVSITTAASPVAGISSKIDVNCNGGNNGAATTTVSGAAPPYNFLWSNGQTNATATNLMAGVYTASVTDKNGCVAVASVTITQPPALTLVTSSMNSNCTAANGTASVSASGGTAPYVYNWSGGGGNNSQTNGLPAGTYSVTVTDFKGCVKTSVATINATPGGVAVISASTNVSCFGYNNGSMTAGFTGNMTAPLSYSWSNGQIAQTATNLSAGTYSVTITDVYGCTSLISANISQPTALNFNVSTTNVSCYGGANGSATANYLGGGTPPLSYLWSAGGASSVAPTLPQGVYTCTLTDANGCVAIQSGTITQPSSVTLTSTVSTANCNQPNGSATITATGGVPAYSYTWSNGATGTTVFGVYAGTYTISVKDANNCLYTTAATIPNTVGPVMNLYSQTNVSCFGGSNGVATATVTGGSAPYTYQWSNGQNTGTATNLVAGVYTATVTDQVGCKASISVNITQPSPLSVNISGTNPRCFGMLNGAANAGVIGGTPGYSYTWTPAGGNGPTATGLGAGNYFVTVQDANGCTATSSVVLINPPQMLASATSTNVSCFNACNGQAIGSATNTIGTVTWYWTGGSSPLATQNVSNLCAGVYTMTATDQNNCTASAIVTITQPSQLTASITSVQNVSCNGYSNGFATVSPAGGTPAYSYSWTPGGSTMATASNLTAGVYSVQVSDAKGCVAIANVTITQPASLQVIATATNITCNGLNNGIGNVTYAGGSSPYSVLWSPTLGNAPTVYNLTSGTHTVLVTDNAGCAASAMISISEPPAITAIVTTTNSNCTQANGSSCISASGGAGGFSYQWNSNPSYTLSCLNNVVAGVYTVVVRDANNCAVTALAPINDISGPNVAITTSSAVSCYGGNNGIAVAAVSGGTGTLSILWSYQAQTTSSVSNLPAGTHFITVMDSATCISSATVQITQPPALSAAISGVTHVSCNNLNNGQATVLANGGTPAYTYSWIPTGQISASAGSLPAGTHTCIITDANGCVAASSVTIVQPAALTINSFTITNPVCNGNNTGQIATTVTGGNPAYTFNWTPAQPGNAIITNLTAGSYTLSVTDTKSCTAYGTYFITEPPALTANAAAIPAKCGNSNGSATVTVNGGTPVYTYNWNTPSPQNTQAISGLSANVWNCNITDANGCVITQSVTITDAPGPQITATSYTSPLCFGQSNGAMGLTFSQGSAPFSVVWSNPSASTTETVTGVVAGVYTATVTDNFGCIASAMVNVTQPSPLVLNMVPTQTVCFGQTIQVYATAGGGTQPYSYSWNPSTLIGGGPHTVSLTASGGFTASAQDANGCPAAAQSAFVFVKPPLTVNGGLTRHCEGTEVSLTPVFTSPGNGGPYTYQWNDGSSGPSLNMTAVYQSTNTTYWVIIKDGCTSPDAVATFSLKVDPLPAISFAADNVKGCAPLNVVLNAVTSCSNPSFMWTSNNESYTSNPVKITYEDAGVYSLSLTVTSPEGCTKAVNAINYIEVYPTPVADFVANPAVTSEFSPGILFENRSTGAVAYAWDFGDPGSSNNTSGAFQPEHIYEAAGEHTVVLVASSNKGCLDTAVQIIQVTPEFALYIPNAFTPNSDGKNDVFLPLGIGLDENRFLMIIFDRWGDEIFKTEDLQQGWNGSVKGNNIVAEQGVYVYKILVGDKQGGDHKFVGHVSCLPKENKFSGK